jgi:catechol 2,3-dioxygenase
MPDTDGRILADETAMGAVTLRVGDLESMSAYYASAFAMQPLEERTRGREVHRVLGRDTTPLVRLIHTPDLPAVDPRQPGLFHTAFLFDDEAALAATVYRAAQDPRSRFSGSSDHHVSEAFYFTDPEDNGVELYRDRARTDWIRTDGQIYMTTTYLDPNAYLQRFLSQEALDAGPSASGRVGHVHLQVGDIPTAEAFYLDALGFGLTQNAYPGALFASAGGYHHHIAMNTWNSAGAGPRAASLGLGEASVTVPTVDEIVALEARLTARSIPFASDGRSVTVDDPWGTTVTVNLPDLSTDELLAR